jgi:hypothetical protein
VCKKLAHHTLARKILITKEIYYIKVSQTFTDFDQTTQASVLEVFLPAHAVARHEVSIAAAIVTTLSPLSKEKPQ